MFEGGVPCEWRPWLSRTNRIESPGVAGVFSRPNNACVVRVPGHSGRERWVRWAYRRGASAISTDVAGLRRG